MTIPHRTNNFKELENCSQGQTVDRYGISVFREANHGLLDPALEAIGQLGKEQILALRGKDAEKPAAINLLELREAKTICEIGHVAIENAIDELYSNIYELRKQHKVEPERVGVFGYDLSPVKVIGVTLAEPYQSQILQERTQVIDALNEMAALNPEDFVYIHPKIPHISLAKIRKNTPSEKVQQIVEAVERTLPTELILKRAVIYNPIKFK